MKKHLHHTWFFVLLLALTATGLSCARKIHFEPSIVVPAADACVKITKDRNDNYAIDLTAVHLAPSEKLVPPKKYYLVWVETSSNELRNVGRLESTTHLFSKALKATLHATTAFEPERIFITAEDEGRLQDPLVR